MKKRILILLGVLVIAGAAAGVCWKMGVFSGSGDSGSQAYVTQVSDITGDVSGVANRYAGVVEPQETVEVELESGRTVKEVQVETGEQVKQGQLLFEYDLSSIQEDLAETQLELDRLVNEAASLNEQIASLEKEKKNASQDSQLSYTIEIETNKMNLRKNQYDQKSKQAEISKLQNATGNTEVRSTIDGVIQKIDTSKLTTDDGDSLDTGMDDFASMSGTDSSSNAFITILSTGAYRIKGTVNEMNISNIIEGQPVIVRSRVDEEQIWRGTMGSVDLKSASSDTSNNMYGLMDASGDSQTSSSTYPFYVNLDSSDGLMLGQHVYIEMDEGQEDKKEGLWLSEFYIVDADTNNPYVWAADGSKKLEKRPVILGQYDEDLAEYEIADGLTKNDYIAYPSELLTEGMATTTNSAAAQAEGLDMVPADDGMYSDDAALEEEMLMDDAGMPEDGMIIDDTGMPEDGMIIDDTGMSEDGTIMDDTGAYEDDAYVEEGTADDAQAFDDSEMSSGVILDDELVPVE
ncbi:MAG TPA: efflux RND transporter periplasmic adaptor subunit [Candidatus Blautia faecipullorum]|nr:efflux RND transporter periplasmic adaptor subunit [Candidatus Blautia faecipullorum]